MPRLAPLAVLAALTAGSAASEQIIHEDFILDGNLCVGVQCTSNDANPATPIKIKALNPNIRFQDGSSAPFSGRDWRIQINDNISGISRFAVVDEGANRTVFTIEGAAPSNALYVRNNGNIGIGTTVPARAMHIVSPDVLTALRFENSFASPPWDVGLVSNAFAIVRADDYHLPFVIEPDVTSTLTMTGPRVGLGENTPTAGLLHLRSKNGPSELVVEAEGDPAPRGLLRLINTGTVYLSLEDTSLPDADHSGRAWNFQNQNGTFRVTTRPGGPGEIEMLLTPQGDMHIKGQLYTGTGGTSTTCASGCDAVFAPGYDLPSLSEQMAAIRAKGHLPAVGPTPENGPHNLSQMVGGTLNELEKAYLYIDQLSAELASLRAKVDGLSRPQSH